MKPSDDPKADKLVNSNISQPNEQMEEMPMEYEEETEPSSENASEEVPLMDRPFSEIANNQIK